MRPKVIPDLQLASVRQEIRNLAQKILAINYTLESTDVPLLPADLESILRHSNLPFAVDEYIRQQYAKIV